MFRAALAGAVLVLFLQAASFALFSYERHNSKLAQERRYATVDLARTLSRGQYALHDAVKSQRPGAFEHHFALLHDIGELSGTIRAGAAGDPEILTAMRDLDRTTGRWRQASRDLSSGDARAAAARLDNPAAEQELIALLTRLDASIERDRAAATARSARSWAIYLALLSAQILFAGLMVLTITKASRGLRREARARHLADNGQALAQRRLELLYSMHDMLQSVEDNRDANLILTTTAAQLLPQAGGALYVFNNSGDRLQLSTSWNDANLATPGHIAPSECWALKRGRMQINDPAGLGLRCAHNPDPDGPIVEAPMIARGQLLGMLMLGYGTEVSAGELAELRLVASALADGMSLALANMALRERLQTQALRDGLTGLYNRRYMQDILARLMEASGPGGTPTSVIMVDLDHFKRINDEHGHAVGDNVLREIGSIILSGLRSADVACRYGGEELVVILPGCEHGRALEVAEGLRGRIGAISENRGFRVSASLGVATAPAHASDEDGLLAAADTALYAAKNAGRNRVSSADPLFADMPGPSSRGTLDLVA